MPFDAPFRLGPFRVHEDGRLALAQPDIRPRFHLCWQGCRVDVSLRAAPGGPAQGDGWMELEAGLGRVPSTAGCAPPRDGVFAALRDVGAVLPAGWRLLLLPDHRVALAAGRPMPLPSTVTALVAEVTMFLLELGPYLELLAEVGVEPAAPGMAKTCPG